MTSSNGADWSPKVSEDSGKTRRIDANIPEWLYSQLEEEAAAAFRTIPGQLCFDLRSHFLNKTSLLQSCTPVLDSARRSGEEGKSVTTDNLPLQFFSHQQSATTAAVESDSPKIDPPITPKGESAGKSEGKRKGSSSFEKVFPPCLEEFEKEILEFWKAKGGKKSERAWTRLMGQLSKIHAHLNVGRSVTGREQFLDQIDLAIAKGFESIEFSNFQAFANPGKGAAPKPEQRHPQQPIKGSVSPEVAARLEADRAALAARLEREMEKRGLGGERS